MGNIPQGVHNLDSCVLYPSSHFQLNCLDVTPSVSIVSAYYLQDHMVFIGHESVDCFLNTTLVNEYVIEKPHSVNQAHVTKNALFLALSNGFVTILDPVTLEFKDKIVPEKLIPGQATCMIQGHSMLFLGHIAGDITMWDLETKKLFREYSTPIISPVEYFAYSYRYSLLCVSSGNTTGCKVKIIGTKRHHEMNLEGVVEKCVGLITFDDRNLLCAQETYRNQILLWDIISGSLLVIALCPEFFPKCSVSSICQTNFGNMGFAIGFTHNSIAWGEIKYNEEACQYYFLWSGRAKSTVDGNVVALRYSQELKGLIIICDRPLVLFLKDLNKETVKVQNKKPLFALSEHEEHLDYSTNVKVYRKGQTNKVTQISQVSQDVVKKIRERLDGKQEYKEREIEDKEKIVNFMKIHEEEMARKVVEEKEVEEIEEKKIEESKDQVVDLVENIGKELNGGNIEKTIENNEEKLKIEKDTVEDEPRMEEDIIVKTEIHEHSECSLIPEESNKPSKQIIEPSIVEKTLEIPNLHNQDTSLEEKKETVSNTIIHQVIKENLPITIDAALHTITEPLTIELSQTENSQKIQNHHNDVKNSSEAQLSLSQSKPIENIPEKSLEKTEPIEESKGSVPEEKINFDEPSKTLTSGESIKDAKTAPAATVTLPIKKQLSPFQVFLNSKKPELLKETPSATHKEIVLKVTQLWGQLTEVEKRQYSL